MCKALRSAREGDAPLRIALCRTMGGRLSKSSAVSNGSDEVSAAKSNLNGHASGELPLDELYEGITSLGMQLRLQQKLTAEHDARWVTVFNVPSSMNIGHAKSWLQKTLVSKLGKYAADIRQMYGKVATAAGGEWLHIKAAVRNGRRAMVRARMRQ